MFYKKNYAKINEKYLECINRVFAEGSGGSVNDETSTTYENGEGVSLYLIDFEYHPIYLQILKSLLAV